MAYLEGYKNIWKRLPISVVEVNSKLFNGNNSHYSFKHGNNSPYTKENRKKRLKIDKYLYKPKS